MKWFTPPRRFQSERMDEPGVPHEMLVENLRDIARFNYLFGGVRAVLHHLDRLVRARTPGAPISVLDLGTGSADIPRAIVCWSRQRNLTVRVTAVDINPVMLELARKECSGFPEITVERQSLLDLPYAANSFDFVVISMVLHHFTEADVVCILRRAAEIASHGYVMADLRRGRVAYALTWIVTRLFSRNPITRHDGPASIENAFTPYEMRRLAEQAGVRNGRIHRHLGFRMVLAGTK